MALERIFCPIDLKSTQDIALSYGLAMAREYEAHLYVCYVAESGCPTQEELDAILDQIRDAVEHHCYQTEGGRPGLPYWEPIVVDGDAAEIIPIEAARHHADLIIMRSRRKNYAATLLGSTAEAVSRSAPCPVLITHSRERDWIDKETGRIALKNILMAYDFSPDSELALNMALTLAEEYQAELHMLHVIPPPAGSDMPEEAGRRIEYATRRLQDSLPDEAKEWCATRLVVREGKPYMEILEYAEESAVDLICMGVRGAGFGMQALFGSNVDRVLRQAECPILIARPLKLSSFVLSEQKIEGDNPKSVDTQ